MLYSTRAHWCHPCLHPWALFGKAKPDGRSWGVPRKTGVGVGEAVSRGWKDLEPLPHRASGPT